MRSIAAIPAFNDNYIWCLYDTDTRKALVVDPGQASPVETYLADNDLTLDTILITHHHPDHVGGVATLEANCRPARIVAPESSPYQGGTERVADGDVVDWQGLAFEVIAVPGHTLDHLAYHTRTQVSGHPVLFCGDTLFVCGCGRLFEGSPAQMRTSLAKLRALPGDTAVYCAHEYTLANVRYARHLLPDDEALQHFESQCQQRRARNEPTVPVILEQESQLNPFLRWDDPDVEKAARVYAEAHGLATGSADDVFAAVRHGKDHF